MAETTGNNGIVLEVKGDGCVNSSSHQTNTEESGHCCWSVPPFVQKLIAEACGTYFLVFAGCGAVAVNLNYANVVTLPGIAMAFGLAVVAVAYSIGHISGAHVNPAVTIAFATCNHFPLKQVPAYVAAQIFGSLLASGTLRLLFMRKDDHFVGTHPSGSDMQSFVVEFITTFYLMFVVSAVTTDNRAIGKLGGLAVGATLMLFVLIAASISGGSMNPARSLGPAIVWYHFQGIWIYLVAPTLGAIAGGWTYNALRVNHKPHHRNTGTGSISLSTGPIH